MTTKSSWTLEVLEDPDDPEGAILQFPTELMEAAGWHEGDELIWTNNQDGSWTLTKSTI
jgi:hypothetical protein